MRVVLLSLLIWTASCAALAYFLLIAHDFSATFESLKSLHEIMDIQHQIISTSPGCMRNNASVMICTPCELRMRPGDAFGQTVINVFQRYEILELTGCYEKKSQCFQIIRTAMSYLLDRQFVARFMLSAVKLVGSKWMFFIGPRRAINKLQLQRLKQRHETMQHEYKTQ